MIELKILWVVNGSAEFVMAHRLPGEWLCDIAEILTLLNTISMPHGYYPDPELTLVEHVTKMLAGQVTDFRIHSALPADAVA